MEEFLSQFREVIKLYDKSKFPTARTAAFYRDLKHFNSEELKEMVEYIVVNHYAPPTMRQLKEHAGHIFSKATNRRTKEIENALQGRECRQCANTGIIDAIEIEDPFQQMYAFRCQCPAGIYKANGLNYFTEEHYQYFKILKTTEEDSTSTVAFSMKDLPQLKSL